MTDAQRDEYALSLLKQFNGRIDNKAIIEKTSKHFRQPVTRWTNHGWINSLRLKHKFPYPPRGGFRVKNGVEIEKHKKNSVPPTEHIEVAAPEREPANDKPLPPKDPARCEQEFQELGEMFRQRCVYWGLVQAQLIYIGGDATCTIQPQPPLIEIKI